jgi:hypothetical protein
MISSVAKVALAATVATGATASLQATLTAGGHAPKIGAHWAYSVRATAGGKPAAAKVTAQIIDPLGGKHPVGFGAKKGNVTDVPFKGRFSDFVVWPESSSGVPLVFRITVSTGTAKRILNYKVTPGG